MRICSHEPKAQVDMGLTFILSKWVTELRLRDKHKNGALVSNTTLAIRLHNEHRNNNLHTKVMVKMKMKKKVILIKYCSERTSLGACPP
jgi:hypothetical protein